MMKRPREGCLTWQIKIQDNLSELLLINCTQIYNYLEIKTLIQEKHRITS